MYCSLIEWFPRDLKIASCCIEIKCLLEFYPKGLWKHGTTNSELALEGTTLVNFVASLTSHKVPELRQILHLLL